MGTYKIETTVTKDGTITLPPELKQMFSHRVEIILKDKGIIKPGRKLKIPTYRSGGKIRDFNRDELYDDVL